MLVFCEDCGERNVVDPDKVRAENNQYRCQICNFLNPFLVKETPAPSPAASAKSSDKLVIDKEIIPTKDQKTEKSGTKSPKKSSKSSKRIKNRKIHNIHEEPHKKIFNKIATNNNILGAYIYHFSDGVIACDIDEELTEATILQIGKALSVCSPFGHKILKNTKEIYLVLDDQVAVSKNITVNSLLVLLCDSYPIPLEINAIFNQSINSLQVFI